MSKLMKAPPPPAVETGTHATVVWGGGPYDASINPQGCADLVVRLSALCYRFVDAHAWAYHTLLKDHMAVLKDMVKFWDPEGPSPPEGFPDISEHLIPYAELLVEQFMNGVPFPEPGKVQYDCVPGNGTIRHERFYNIIFAMNYDVGSHEFRPTAMGRSQKYGELSHFSERALEGVRYEDTYRSEGVELATYLHNLKWYGQQAKEFRSKGAAFQNVVNLGQPLCSIEEGSRLSPGFVQAAAGRAGQSVDEFLYGASTAPKNAFLESPGEEVGFIPDFSTIPTVVKPTTRMSHRLRFDLADEPDPWLNGPDHW